MPTTLKRVTEWMEAIVLFSHEDGLDRACEEMGTENDWQFYLKLSARPLHPHFQLISRP